MGAPKAPCFKASLRSNVSVLRGIWPLAQSPIGRQRWELLFYGKLLPLVQFVRSLMEEMGFRSCLNDENKETHYMGSAEHAGFFCFCLFLFVFVFFFRAAPAAYIPRLGVKLELQLLAYPTATAMQDPSCVFDLHHSSRQCQIPNPLSEARNRTLVLTDTSRVH